MRDEQLPLSFPLPPFPQCWRLLLFVPDVSLEDVKNANSTPLVIHLWLHSSLRRRFLHFSIFTSPLVPRCLSSSVDASLCVSNRRLRHVLPMSSLSIWNPTSCTLQLVFSRQGGSSAPIQSGSTYQGTSVIRYRLGALSDEGDSPEGTYRRGSLGVTDNTGSSDAFLSEYEEFRHHQRVVATKHALHLHALTNAAGIYKDAKPLQVTSYQVNCVSSSSSSNAGGASSGKGDSLKVLSVEQEDATAAASSAFDKSTSALERKQKSKSKAGKKSGAAASEEARGSGGSDAGVVAASADWGSKLVLFEGADAFAQGSEVELTVQFLGTVQSFDHGGIYAAKAENGAAPDAPLLTHLEVRFARCAFPCPDDPQYRLDWRLKSIQLPDSYTTVLTNSEELGRRVLSAQHAVQLSFSPCGPLPVYVFSFACFPEQLEQVAATMDVPEFSSDVVQGLTNHTSSISCVSIPVRVLARRQARIPVATLERVLRITLEAVVALQQLFGCPLPLLQCRHLDVLLGPTMPFISGMEHHCSIILNESIFQSGKKTAGSGDTETEQAELVVHELTHHWVGNALGLPFAVKEGICQIVEQCLGDTLLNRPMRKFKPDTVATATAKAVNRDSTAVAATTSSSARTTAAAVASSNTIQASEKGHEFTGTSYQQALSAIRRLVADSGFETFGRCLRHVVYEQVVMPTIAVEEQGGAQMMRRHGAAVPTPPYLSTEDFLRLMEASV